MRKIFGVKCVKVVAFCIVQKFTSTDVDALTYKIEDLIIEAPSTQSTNHNTYLTTKP